MLASESENVSAAISPPTSAAIENERDRETERHADAYWQSVLDALAVSGGDSRLLPAGHPYLKEGPRSVPEADGNHSPEQGAEARGAFSF